MFSEKIAFFTPGLGPASRYCICQPNTLTLSYALPPLSISLFSLSKEITKLPKLALDFLQPRQNLGLELEMFLPSPLKQLGLFGSSSWNEGCIFDTNQNCFFYRIKVKLGLTYFLEVKNASTENKVVLHCIVFMKIFFDLKI